MAVVGQRLLALSELHEDTTVPAGDKNNISEVRQHLVSAIKYMDFLVVSIL
jgi:hypothetical protein